MTTCCFGMGRGVPVVSYLRWFGLSKCMLKSEVEVRFILHSRHLNVSTLACKIFISSRLKGFSKVQGFFGRLKVYLHFLSVALPCATIPPSPLCMRYGQCNYLHVLYSIVPYRASKLSTIPPHIFKRKQLNMLLRTKGPVSEPVPLKRFFA